MTDEIEKLQARLNTFYAGGIWARISPQDARTWAKALGQLSEIETLRQKRLEQIAALRLRDERWEIWGRAQIRLMVYSFHCWFWIEIISAFVR